MEMVQVQVCGYSSCLTRLKLQNKTKSLLMAKERKRQTYSCPVFLITSLMLFSCANCNPAATSLAEVTLTAKST